MCKETVTAQVVMAREMYMQLQEEARACDVSFSAYVKVLIAEARRQRDKVAGA